MNSNEHYARRLFKGVAQLSTVWLFLFWYLDYMGLVLACFSYQMTSLFALRMLDNKVSFSLVGQFNVLTFVIHIVWCAALTGGSESVIMWFLIEVPIRAMVLCPPSSEIYWAIPSTLVGAAMFVIPQDYYPTFDVSIEVQRIIRSLTFICIAFNLYLDAKAYKQLQSELTRTIIDQKNAQAASKVKSMFLASMSHELRTPLFSIIGWAELLQDQLTLRKLNASEIKMISNIHSCSCILLRIIGDVLDFSKIEANQIILENKPFSVQQVVDQISLLESNSYNKPVRLYTHIVGNHLISDNLKGDKMRIGQCLSNLVGNALKFTQEGEVNVYVSSEFVPGSRDKVKLIFEVQDTGIGIPPEKLSLIFNPFTQADETTTRRFGGTGLGLSIVKSLVELMGGQITVWSKAGVGSKFTFYVIVDMSYENPFSSEGNFDCSRIFNSLSVLVADDNSLNQTLIAAYLKKLNINYVLVNNGQEAFDRWNQNRDEFGLIFLDYHMPLLNGFECLRKIRRELELRPAIRRVPIILITADSQQQTEIEARNSGFDDVLSKPFTLAKLQAVVMHHRSRVSNIK
eukprot:TRINITY_DN2442_c0_g1_i1.p1 TRINITY_DN2442_c0_g1~~TRINITY_DN2442_c0_g1_i1.p1  ORF type:complete len:571 (-),score=77.44 TRINITY_DN2442_c0_g1_i1:375-2087(-)